MRSLHVLTSNARRGAETFATQLTDALRAPDHQTRTVALARSGDPGCLNVAPLGPGRRSPRSLAALRRAARTADVVVAHGSSTLEACAVALAGTGVPFVYRNIGDPTYWAVGARRRNAIGWMLRRASRVAALWPEAARQISSLHGVPLERIDVIPNGVDEQRFPFAAEDERARSRARLGVSIEQPCLAFVGALSTEKAPGTAVAAGAALEDAVLLVVGAGPLESDLRIQADRHAPGRVRFLGQLTDLQPVYAAADLVLLPSVSEGMPAVPIEAALVGTPTVATCVGGVPWLIEDAVTGFLSPPSDEGAFVRRVRQALATAAETGTRAATEVRGHYSIEHAAALWRRTLSKAMASQADAGDRPKRSPDAPFLPSIARNDH